jgi:predicted metal-dependent HD superfamily phosphohydrolase/protein-S-isoprenylcysteine O-methyltransferase Ste14
MTEQKSGILAKAKAFVEKLFEERFTSEYVFHDFPHTQNVVEAVILIGTQYKLTDTELEILQLAAWFHDTGYYKTPEGHELLSSTIAEEFLAQEAYPEENINTVKSCIMATRLPQKPISLLEEILCDADLSHLGNEQYWDRCGRLRQEMLLAREIVMSEQEWVDFELDFMIQHRYHTDVARSLFDKRKRKHISQLNKQKLRLMPEAMEIIDSMEGTKKKNKKKKKKGTSGNAGLKELDLGRGVETMYRTTYRTHVNLSSIADNKANFMLTINAVVISFVVTSLIPQTRDQAWLMIPTIVLLTVCLVALVFAIMATRPKVTEGLVTKADIQARKTNLLFFGNFYRMDLDDFHWGMTEMIKDPDFLYSSMTRDLYYLGVVLAKKYRLLRICYGIFMYGIIASVIAFVIAAIVTGEFMAPTDVAPVE